MRWHCQVCGFVFEGDNPPDECPVCSSSREEFTKKLDKFEYKGKKYDVLLINGSAHTSHNTAVSLKLVQEELKKKKVSFETVHLARMNLMPCWCCYSNYDEACTYPCRNSSDDAHHIHEAVLNSKAVIVLTPINWNSMSGRLKILLDRMTCVQNLGLLGKRSLTLGKVLGVSVTGHEDGALKTAMDIFLYFEEMGFILAPFSFQYRTHNSQHNTKEDNPFLKADAKLKKDIKGLVNNVVEMIGLGLEKKLEGKIIPVCE